MRPPPVFFRHAAWISVVAAAIPVISASAQGFGLNEVGTCAVSRGFAATGTPCSDATTIFWNPAAAAELTGRSLSIGASDIVVNGAFDQDNTGRSYHSNIRPSLPPAAFGAMRIGNASVGLGVYVPYGLTSQWNTDFPGRFEALRASLQTIYIQPNFAYQLTDNWSVGGGPVFGRSTVDLTQSLDLSQQFAQPGVTFGQLGIAYQTEFARAKFHGTSSAVGYNIGAHGRYGPWSVGIRYLSALNFSYSNAKATFTQVPTGLVLAQGNPVNPSTSIPVDGLLSAQFGPGGPLVSQAGSSKITHPWQLQGGVGYSGFEGTTLSADIARIGWSSFATLPVTFDGPASANSKVLIEDYHDSWAYRFGAERKFQSLTGRLGYSFANTPAPDATVTPLLPDMNRRNFSAGLGIPLSNITTVDLGYVHVNTPGRRGRIVERTSEAQTATQLNTGTYALTANVFSAAINVTF